MIFTNSSFPVFKIPVPSKSKRRFSLKNGYVVSEETGGISVAINGEFQLRLSAEKLENILSKEMNL